MNIKIPSLQWIDALRMKPKHPGWVFLHHQCDCCEETTVSVARYNGNEWLFKPLTEKEEIKPIKGIAIHFAYIDFPRGH